MAYAVTPPPSHGEAPGRVGLGPLPPRCASTPRSGAPPRHGSGDAATESNGVVDRLDLLLHDAELGLQALHGRSLRGDGVLVRLLLRLQIAEHHLGVRDLLVERRQLALKR